MGETERLCVATLDASRQTGLRFDFNKAVEDARRDFPDALKNVTFIDLDAPDVEAQMKKFTDSLSDKGRKELGFRQYENHKFMTKDAQPTVWRTTDGRGVLLAYGTRTHMCEAEKIQFNADDPAKILHYTFSHELGHLVVKNAYSATNYAEHGADVFAAMRGFQSGFLTRKDVQTIANGRDMLGWLNCDITHVTSMSLDALLINPKQVDFMTLSPKETAALAAKHAAAFALEGDYSGFVRLVNAMPRWGLTLDELRADRLSGLADIVLRSDKNSLPFYYAARVLLTAQAKKESGDPYLARTEMQGAKWDKVFEEIALKNKGRDIGAIRAATQDGSPKPQSTLQKLAGKLKPLSI
jgi:hypothetical protein